MPHVAPVEGVLIGLERRPYNEFVTDSGERRPAGETLWAHVMEADQDAPTSLKIGGPQAPAIWRELEAVGRGNSVRIEVGVPRGTLFMVRSVDEGAAPPARRAPLKA